MQNQSALSLALSKTIVTRALKVALIVGTLLAMINHGDKMLTFSIAFQDWMKIALSYLVPYVVSTWSAVSVLRAQQQ